jgi:hypothetical protein
MMHSSIAALALVTAMAATTMASAQSGSNVGAGGAGLGAGTSQMAPLLASNRAPTIRVNIRARRCSSKCSEAKLGWRRTEARAA